MASMWCSKCQRETTCKAFTPDEYREHGMNSWDNRNMKSKVHEDIRWYERQRTCQRCGMTFSTAEIDYRLIKEFERLRTAMKQIESAVEGSKPKKKM